MNRSLVRRPFNVNTVTMPVPDKGMVRNSDAGFVFGVDKFSQLRRFLVIGTEGGSFYATEGKLTKENVKNAEVCLKEDPKRFVDLVATVSRDKIALKNEYAIYALAMASSHDDVAIRRLALSHLGDVCRTGTHLFQFVSFRATMRGKAGRVLRRAIGRWYSEKNTHQLALQVLKYGQRFGWTHRDLLRISHPKITSESQQAVINWVIKDSAEATGEPLIDGFNEVREFHKSAAYKKNPKRGITKIAKLVVDASLPREAIERIDTNLLEQTEIWEALLPDMPIGALVRNLGKITSIGLAKELSATSKLIIDKLGDPEAVKRSGIHPIAVLTAMKVYGSGRGVKGGLTWNPNDRIVDALDGAFYESFKNVKPTGKRTLLALDISGSMTYSKANGLSMLTPRDISAAMAMVTARTEQEWGIVGFHNSLMPLKISPKQRLDEIVKYIDRLGFGSTDISLPMRFATDNKMAVDVFAVYTDNELNTGRTHPFEALKQYRRVTGINAKLVVVATTATKFTIADPSDAGMLDIAGFSSDAPQVISLFSRGEL